MSDLAIRTVNLKKAYQIRQRAGSPRTSTLREALPRLGRRQAGGVRRETVWALNDVSFEITQGEVVGLIGRNGAGKSTLLKIFSRVTEPTSGYVDLFGRVGSLLEVGTGFHPELTGRENIQLHGVILGMKRAEISRNFDAIVEFSGVERYLDTPVKRYSSGMRLRLAFAVAAHLDTEILLVDEVLSVGDYEFQKKSFDKILDVIEEGRTVVIVSHNMSMISSLCKSTILLDAGRLLHYGDTSTAVRAYSDMRARASPATLDQSGDRAIGDERATLVDVWIDDDMYGNRVTQLDIGRTFRVTMQYRLHTSVAKPPSPGFRFSDQRGECAFVTQGTANSEPATAPGVYAAECTVPSWLLNDGTYVIGVSLTFPHDGGHVSFDEQAVLTLTMLDPLEAPVDVETVSPRRIPGLVRPLLEWTIRRVPEDVVSAG